MKFDRIISSLIASRIGRIENQKDLRRTYPNENWDFMDQDIKDYEEAIELLEKHNA